MTRCNWTMEETELLIEYYPHRSTKEVAFITGKSIAQCYAKAFALQLHKTPEYLATEASGRFNKKKNNGNKYIKFFKKICSYFKNKIGQ